jgi:hypothetical protein
MSQSAVRSVVRLVRSPVLTEEAAVFEFRLSRKFPELLRIASKLLALIAPALLVSSLFAQSNLDALYPMAKDPKPFVCPADKELQTAGKPDTFRTSYQIVNNPLEQKFATTPANRIAIVIEKRANHKGQRFVLFYDVSVRAFGDTQFER